MKVVFAAGGTAGHINPALAIADKIKDVFPKSEIVFVGTPDGLEAQLVTKAGYKFTPFRMAGIQRKLSLRNIKRNVTALYYYSTAKKKAEKLLKSFNPDIVIGTGGYVSAPVLLSAHKLGIKSVNHESNSLPGVTTKMLSKTVDRTFVANKDAIAYLHNPERCVVTGNPLRTNIPIQDKKKARRELGLPDGMTILSFGGSLGANKITEAVIALLGWEQEQGDVNHIHAYGGNGEAVFSDMLAKSGVVPDKKRVILKEYIHNMYTCLCAADLVISRAGAMTLTELMAIGRASVLIPFPKAAENHQYFNAKTMSDANAAILIEDKDLTAEKLAEVVKDFYAHRQKLEIMSENAKKMAITDAADRILSQIITIIGNDNIN